MYVFAAGRVLKQRALFRRPQHTPSLPALFTPPYYSLVLHYCLPLVPASPLSSLPTGPSACSHMRFPLPAAGALPTFTFLPRPMAHFILLLSSWHCLYLAHMPGISLCYSLSSLLPCWHGMPVLSLVNSPYTVSPGSHPTSIWLLDRTGRTGQEGQKTGRRTPMPTAHTRTSTYVWWWVRPTLCSLILCLSLSVPSMYTRALHWFCYFATYTH